MNESLAFGSVPQKMSLAVPCNETHCSTPWFTAGQAGKGGCSADRGASARGACRVRRLSCVNEYREPAP